MEIKDSGARREFGTGAVRDIQEGKGRCDLMPLDVVGAYTQDMVIGSLGLFQKDPITAYLESALGTFRSNFAGNEPTEQDASMLLEVSKHFEEGAKKYGENNWQKGIPVHCYIDSAVRHYLKLKRGDRDEPHDRAFVWNILCAIWTCRNHPELNDMRNGNRTKTGETKQAESVPNVDVSELVCPLNYLYANAKRGVDPIG